VIGLVRGLVSSLACGQCPLLQRGLLDGDSPVCASRGGWLAGCSADLRFGGRKRLRRALDGRIGARIGSLAACGCRGRLRKALRRFVWRQRTCLLPARLGGGWDLLNLVHGGATVRA